MKLSLAALLALTACGSSFSEQPYDPDGHVSASPDVKSDCGAPDAPAIALDDAAPSCQPNAPPAPDSGFLACPEAKCTRDMPYCCGGTCSSLPCCGPVADVADVADAGNATPPQDAADAAPRTCLLATPPACPPGFPYVTGQECCDAP